MLCGVTAAFLYVFSERPLYMEIPKEGPASENPRPLASLVRSLNGSRDPSQLNVWDATGTWKPRDQRCSRSPLESNLVELKLVLHVDDFLVGGEEHDLGD